jgi:hypothetical protein
VNSTSKILALLAVGLLVLNTKATPIMQQNQPEEKNIIIVSGDGQAKTDPDMAVVSVGISKQSATAKTAQESVNKTAEAIRDAVLKVVGDRKLIQTSGLSLFPQSNQNGKTIGYQASNMITITVNDIAKAGDVVDAATDAGATNLNDITFGLKDPKKSRAAALKDAVADAKSKADALAEALGVTITEIVQVMEGGSNYNPYPVQFKAAAMEMRSGAPIEAGQVELGASVTIKYRFSR